MISLAVSEYPSAPISSHQAWLQGGGLDLLDGLDELPLGLEGGGHECGSAEDLGLVLVSGVDEVLSGNVASEVDDVVSGSAEHSAADVLSNLVDVSLDGSHDDGSLEGSLSLAHQGLEDFQSGLHGLGSGDDLG